MSNTPNAKMDTTMALLLCRHIEAVVAPLGWHVALTGGCLYKDGPRKDADLAFYRHDIRQPTRHYPDDIVRALTEARLFVPIGDEPASSADKEVRVGRFHGRGGAIYRIDCFFL